MKFSVLFKKLIVKISTTNRVHCFRSFSTRDVISIGDVSVSIKKAKCLHLVPVFYRPENVPQSILRHLRWMMQKDVLGQDMFLIGPPGSLKRSITMMYLETVGKEFEYISLSRDTTESDLKQRRELIRGTAKYIDQCAVRAAVEGRILILEGIEKAERNVLPVLNNLLENREMQLDDGRFLMSSQRYDKLVQTYTLEQLEEMKICRVHPDFRVIALGLPIPRYRGNPLDPPFRSRFQARDVGHLPFKEHLGLLTNERNSPSDHLSKLLSLGLALKTQEAKELNFPDFPLDNLSSVATILREVPCIGESRLVDMLYPQQLLLSKEGTSAIRDLLQSFGLVQDSFAVASVEAIQQSSSTLGWAKVNMKIGSRMASFKVPCGSLSSSSSSCFVSTPFHVDLICGMIISHVGKDFCIVGPRGCGKTTLVMRFSDLLGYRVENVILFQDMTPRDLLQRRIMNSSGDTEWKHSNLIDAALDGRLAVLDGLHRINPGTLAVLNRLIHDRELDLYDGSRLLRHDRYDFLQKNNEWSDEEMRDRKLLRIHPSFRIVALSEPPSSKGSGPNSKSSNWLTPELLTSFLYHNVRQMTPEEEMEVVRHLVPSFSQMEPVLKFANKLRTSSNNQLKSVSASLSTSQLVRIAKRLSSYELDEDVHHLLHRACLSRFLPPLTKNAFEEELYESGIKSISYNSIDSNQDLDAIFTCEVKNGKLRIGRVETNVYQSEEIAKVPDVLFYDNAQHIQLMEDMLKDFLLDEHLLLVGNQGVGKNKIVDKFLNLLNRPREYIQLHRDTTVQTLTVQPTVQEGIVGYEDSPLVKAVKWGRVLVVDEADKAPTNVTCVLKCLVQSGEMHLSDGRSIVPVLSPTPSSESRIKMHPDFRMIVLANRPGFPFLGNDFFGTMGDAFATHAVDNPDPSSELSMLKRYGPAVDKHVLQKIVAIFGELRDMADKGQVLYPFSTREAVSLVKHLQTFPDDGLAKVVENVFDFDAYDLELRKVIVEVMQKHGVPIGASTGNIQLSKEFPLPELKFRGRIETRKVLNEISVQRKHVFMEEISRLIVRTEKIDSSDSRSLFFKEEEALVNLPLLDGSSVVHIAATLGDQRQPMALDLTVEKKVKGDVIHVLAVHPLTLYSVEPSRKTLTFVDLSKIVPQKGLMHKLKIATFGNPLDEDVVVHDGKSPSFFLVNYKSGSVKIVTTTAAPYQQISDFIFKKPLKQGGEYKLVVPLNSSKRILCFKQGINSVEIIDLLDNVSWSISFPFLIGGVHSASSFEYLISEEGSHRKYLLRETLVTDDNSVDTHQSVKFELLALEDSVSGIFLEDLHLVAELPLNSSQLSSSLDDRIESPNRVIATKSTFAIIVVGLPECASFEVYEWKRSDMNSPDILSPPSSLSHLVYLPVNGIVARIVSSIHLPPVMIKEGSNTNAIGFLEVVDTVNKTVGYIPIPGFPGVTYVDQWQFENQSALNKSSKYSNPNEMMVTRLGNDSLCTVDKTGHMRIWEVTRSTLLSSLEKWKRLVGDGTHEPLQITHNKQLGKVPSEMPKHGISDPMGLPHSGGSTFAGGTGGMSTAGLGGLGGPYRLDGGSDVVFQVSDEDKAKVPKEILEAARRMSLRAWKERLDEIKMSELDADIYERFVSPVRPHIKQLRNVLDSLQAKSKERQWLRHQTHGDVDEGKLIEGVIGEKGIYKRRGEKEPEPGSVQEKPKHVRIVCDASGSMFRFNGHDGRMDRQLESLLMVMEAFQGYEHKISYDVYAHSGEGPSFPFGSSAVQNVDSSTSQSTPKNDKQRLDVTLSLIAHSQFCSSGDHTLEGTKLAIEKVSEMEDVDDRFVIILSDANFERYGISPVRFGQLLTSDTTVNAFAIFIGSLGDQAQRLYKKVPPGRSFICSESKQLPAIMQQIFMSSILP